MSLISDLQSCPAEAVHDCPIEMLVERFMEENALTDDNFSLCYHNTVTGEEYCRNERKLMEAGSTYKLPMNLVFYELEHAGMIPADTLILRQPLIACHRDSLVFSKNEISQVMVHVLGGCRKFKTYIRKYFSFTEDEIDPAYYENNLFSARMMLDFLKYIYANAECFAELLSFMREATPGDYFRKYVRDIPVAHKYGSYNGAENDVGIFYTCEPFLLAVYTQGVQAETVSRAAALMRAYNEVRSADCPSCQIRKTDSCNQ